MPVHPTALVDPAARIDPSADVGPYCIVGAEVEIGARTRLMANTTMEGPLAVGEDNVFFPYSTIGLAPQDLKYKGERSATRIGDRNRVREFVTIHRGTEGGGMLTSIGDDNLLMAYTHVAHDVHIGNHCILDNAATLAGHVVVQDWVVISAFAGVHQFCRIGRHAFVGPHSAVKQDVLPYSMTVAERELKTYGTNKIGLDRRGFTAERVDQLQKAFRLLTRAGLNTTQAIEKIRAEVPESAELTELLDFIATSQRGFIK